jgi:hypothetical protein
LKQLTDLVWPAVKSQVSGEVSRLGTLKAPIVVLEAPLLIEAGWKVGELNRTADGWAIELFCRIFATVYG